MEQHVAAEHLQVIRTLMERSALYRRTLGPIMVYVGAVGTAAALGGIALGIEALPAFGAWWLVAALVAIAGAFLIALAHYAVIYGRDPREIPKLHGEPGWPRKPWISKNSEGV